MSDEEEDYPPPNMALVSSLWAEWVCVVCDWRKIAHPTSDEWTALKKTFHYDKTPIDSVTELEKMRSLK